MLQWSHFTKGGIWGAGFLQYDRYDPWEQPLKNESNPSTLCFFLAVEPLLSDNPQNSNFSFFSFRTTEQGEIFSSHQCVMLPNHPIPMISLPPPHLPLIPCEGKIHTVPHHSVLPCTSGGTFPFCCAIFFSGHYPCYSLSIAVAWYDHFTPLMRWCEQWKNLTMMRLWGLLRILWQQVKLR